MQRFPSAIQRIHTWVRNVLEGGAGILLNLSNDGGFGGSAGAQQHLGAAVLRAIELRRPLLRATSDGITVAIDSGGRVVGRLPARQPAMLEVRVWPGRDTTVFQRFGNAFSWIATLLCAIWTLGESLRAN
ncbi:MAG: hypothetical protein GY725_07685 [bacterium]|nr:hypothetical protein [bacterium]